MEKETERQMKYLRSDHGEEYTSLEFRRYYKKNSIRCHYIVKMTPQQNDVVEKMNRILTEKA